MLHITEQSLRMIFVKLASKLFDTSTKYYAIRLNTVLEIYNFEFIHPSYVYHKTLILENNFNQNYGTSMY